MKNSKIFFSLLITFIFLMIIAACNHHNSLGSTLDDIFSGDSYHVPPTSTPSLEPTRTNLPNLTDSPIKSTPSYSNSQKIEFEQTLTAFYNTLTDSPIDQILTDFYTYHNKRGMQAVENLLQANPDNALALAVRGAFKFREKEWESGFEDSNKALEIDPNLAFAYVNRAWYYQYFKSDRDTARNEIETALQLNPELAYAHCIMAGLHNTDNNSQPRMESCKKAIELRPDYYVAYINLGMLTTPSEDDFNGSMTYFDKAIAINPDDGRAYYERATIFYAFIPDFEKITSDLSQAILLGYDTPDVYYLRAVSYVEIGGYVNAIADFEHILELNPDNPDIYNWAARLIAYTDGDLEKALIYNNKSLAFYPDKDYYVDTKGFIYYKMEKYDEAFQIFNELIESDYQYSYYGRGLIYYKLGDKENAISDFQTYLATQSGSFQIKEVEQLLEEMGVIYD